MRLQHLPSKHVSAAITNPFHSNTLQVISKPKLTSDEFMEKLLNRRWTLLSPETKIHQVIHTHGSHGSNFLLNTHPAYGDGFLLEMNKQRNSFYIVRDDLLHPLVNGNKARKLDALLPLIEDYSVTDVVTCGGCQSAHTAAIAVLCAEKGILSHLLLRGEQPEILTGYNLMSTIYGNVTYVPRTIYANREDMLKCYANSVADNNGSVLWFNDIIQASSTTELSTSPNFVQMDESGSEGNHLRKILIVNEGAGDSVALLGVIRLVEYLSQNHLLGKQRAIKFVVDAGTGTTAVGLGLAALCLGLPWEVYAVMLADKIDGYRKQEERLISEFKKHFNVEFIDHNIKRENAGIVHWVERGHPRKFGNVLEGEVEACQKIAQQTGILVDPVYTLAAWETAMLLSGKEAEGGSEVVMLHSGGTLGMFGLAQSPASLSGHIDFGHEDKLWDEAMYYVLGDPTTKPKGYDPMTEAALLWERDNYVTKTRYKLSPFAISLNEIMPGLLGKLPPTDSRLRPDQRYLENGEYELSNAEKLRLEQLQRQARKRLHPTEYPHSRQISHVLLNVNLDVG